MVTYGLILDDAPKPFAGHMANKQITNFIQMLPRTRIL
jgi:hypothetical protein